MTHNQRASEDLRVKRTHKLILDALIELTIQKGFASVTVRDITRRAGINRATFYRHYQDKFDLLDQYAKGVYDLLDTPSETEPPEAGDGESLAPGLVRMLEHIRANATFYRVMLGKNGDPAFAEKIRQYVRKRIGLSLPENFFGDKRLLDLYLNYSASASVGTVLWWLEQDMPYSPQEMANIAYRLSVTNLEVMLALAASPK